MANYATLKAAIQAAIYENGNNEITGTALQQSLLSMISSLGDGYQFMGVATPSTNPGTPDANVFYLASTTGTYTNFGGLVLDDGEIAILKYNGAWSKDSTGAASLEKVNQLAQHIISGNYTDTPDVYELSQYNALIIASTLKWSTATSAKCAFLPLHGLSKINIAVSGGKGNFAFLQNNTIVNNQLAPFSTQYQSIIEVVDGTNVDFIVPSDADYLYIQTANTSGVDVRSRFTITTYWLGLATKDELAVVDAKVDKVNVHAITPVIEVGSINTSGLDDVSTFFERKYWRTARFIKLFDLSEISATVTTTGTSLRFAYYDSDFTFIEKHDVAVSGSITDTPPASAVYLRVGVDSVRPASSAFNIPKPKLLLEGNFTDDWDTPMNRPSIGSLSILVPVLVSNPDTDATETADLQDMHSLLSDTGVLALPATYNPTGNPTRLIIYCHGAGVNYAIGTGTFPSSDLLPDYWLAEGYAVMDIEGDPYNDTDEHFFIPAARQCYIAAYEFVIRKYNIKKDGILLGGRSMGGGMVFDLLSSRIPIIAACPLVPAINEIWCWEYMNAKRRQFVAQKLGFTGAVPTWTSNSPMSSAEWQYLQDNFNKFIKYSPFFALMPDTPSKTEIFSVGNVGASADNADEATLYDARRFKSKAPVKMFAVRDDETVNNSRNCDLVYKMMLNAAQIVEMRYFLTGGHHFELTSPYLLASHTTIYGETLTNVPVVYVEMLAFWRRYEQGL